MGKRKTPTAQAGAGPGDGLGPATVHAAEPLPPADASALNGGPSPQGAVAARGANLPGEVSANGRRVAIDSLAAVLGKTWARRSREELHREGRAAAGGWPGTVGEATAYVAQALLSGQYRLPMPLLTTLERELLARGVYANARKEWLGHLDPEPAK